MLNPVDTSCSREMTLSRQAAPTIAETAETRLESLAFLQLGQIVCEYQQGALTLHGKVEGYFLQHVACSSVQNIEGVKEVVDRLNVTHPRAVLK